jgi:hypothetical protein
VREQKLTSIACIVAAFALLAVYPDSFMCGAAVVAAIAQFAGLQYLAHRKINEIEEFKEELRILKDRVDGLTITGRMR